MGCGVKAGDTANEVAQMQTEGPNLIRVQAQVRAMYGWVGVTQ